jgi:TM2 domain-containing membrane protein YozV
MNTFLTQPTPEVINAENEIAAVLSIVPGLGHIYKGRFAAGFFWMFVGMPIAIWIGILLGLATAGVGLLFPIACWIAVAVDAYGERDRRKHHRFLPPSGEADENNIVD